MGLTMSSILVHVLCYCTAHNRKCNSTTISNTAHITQCPIRNRRTRKQNWIFKREKKERVFHCRDLLPFGRLPVGSYRFVVTYSSYCVLVCVCTYLPNRLADKGPIIIVILSTVVLCKYNERTCALVVYCSSTGWRVHWGVGRWDDSQANRKLWKRNLHGRKEGRKEGRRRREFRKEQVNGVYTFLASTIVQSDWCAAHTPLHQPHESSSSSSNSMKKQKKEIEKKRKKIVWGYAAGGFPQCRIKTRRSTVRLIEQDTPNNSSSSSVPACLPSLNEFNPLCCCAAVVALYSTRVWAWLGRAGLLLLCLGPVGIVRLNNCWERRELLAIVFGRYIQFRDETLNAQRRRQTAYHFSPECARPS